MTVPHPIPYQGSKRYLAPIILGLFPKDTERLIEPFAGSAAVSLAAAAANIISRFWLNDINEPLIHLWERMVRAPDDLATQYEKLWQMQQGRERRFYDAVRARFNQTHQPHYLLYLLARCVKASVRYNANGEFNQSPDNRRKGRQPNAMRADICQTARLMHGKVAFSSEDYRQVIAQATEGDLVYLDPPYQGVCANRDPRYIEGVTFDDLVAGLAHLNEKHVAYIVSYDGRTGNKTFGKRLPDFLQLQHLEVHAGRSSQATLLGRRDSTYETLYLSPALVERTGNKTTVNIPQQLPLFGELT